MGELKKKEEKKKKKKKGKQKRSSILSPSQFKAAFGITDNVQNDEFKQQQPIGMMQQLDDHGIPINLDDNDEKKNDGMNNDDDEEKKDEINDMITDDEKDKHGFSADDD